jgi:hypothetical protein
LDNLLCQLEEELMAKGGRWIADFNESERNYSLDGVTFDVCIRGDTKIREPGLFSRAMSAFLLPRYLVVCYVVARDTVSAHFLRKCLGLAKNRSKADDVTWTWLIVTVQQTPSKDVLQIVRGLTEKEIGLLVYDRGSGSLAASGNLLGERMKSCVRLWSKASPR